MKKTLTRWLEDAWYKEMYISAWLMPISMIYVDVMRFRRFLYRVGIKKSSRLPVPVIIVGNLTVGGTGKTPLVIWLVAFLKQQGYKPGVISRGYAGSSSQTPQAVTVDSDPALVGDEPLVLARRCACPVVIGVNRPAAALQLLANNDCDIIVSDDDDTERYVRELEQLVDAEEVDDEPEPRHPSLGGISIPDADDLAAELERYLREETDPDDP